MSRRIPSQTARLLMGGCRWCQDDWESGNVQIRTCGVAGIWMGAQGRKTRHTRVWPLSWGCREAPSGMLSASLAVLVILRRLPVTSPGPRNLATQEARHSGRAHPRPHCPGICLRVHHGNTWRISVVNSETNASCLDTRGVKFLPDCVNAWVRGLW